MTLTSLYALRPRAAQLMSKDAGCGSLFQQLSEELIVVARLDPQANQHLLDHDVKALTQMVDAALAEQDNHPDVFRQIAQKLLEMRARVAGALREAAEEIALDAAVATHGQDLGEKDLTDLFTHLPPQSPSQDQGAGSAEPTGFSPKQGRVGRVDGAFEAFVIETAHSIAPSDAVLLPAGYQIRLTEGQAVMLFVQGSGTTDFPTHHKPQSIHLCAGKGGATVTGPAVLMTPFPGALSVAGRAQAQMRLRDLDDKGKYKPLIGGASAGLFAAPVSIALQPDFLAGFEGLATLGMVGLLTAVITTIPLLQWRTRRSESAIRKDDLIQAYYRETSREILIDYQFHPHHQVIEANSLSFFPAHAIHVLPGHSMRVMEPLLALPRPQDAQSVGPALVA